MRAFGEAPFPMSKDDAPDRLTIMTTRTILAAIVLVIGMADCAYARPIDPFGGNTVDVPQGPLVDSWRTVYAELGGDHALLGACVDSTSADCGPPRTLWEIIAEARDQDGLAIIGHINRTINLSITPFEPGEWLTALDAIDAEGDCKAYSTAKYFTLREVGITADRVRLVIVHQRNHVEDHMVVSVYQDGRWLILDNLTLALVQDTDASEYTPLFVLDDHGVRMFGPR
jgi:predicted transglutaminase-like cysteine proteinase